jgi:hypothetical protein
MLTMPATRRGPCSAACSRCGRAARVVESRPWILLASMRSHSPVSAPTTEPRSIRPALLTRVPNPPKRSTVCWTAPSAWVRSVMSASTTSAAPAAWSISAARRPDGPGGRERRTRGSPAADRRRRARRLGSAPGTGRSEPREGRRARGAFLVQCQSARTPRGRPPSWSAKGAPSPRRGEAGRGHPMYE